MASQYIEKVETDIFEQLRTKWHQLTNDGKYAEGLQFCNQYYSWIENERDARKLGIWKSYKGIILTHLGRHKEGLEELLSAWEIADTIKQPELCCYVINAIVRLYCNREFYPNALEFSKKALPYVEQLDNLGIKFNFYNLTAGIHFELGNDEKAADYFSKTIEIAGLLENFADIAMLTDNKGYTFMRRNDYQTALEFYLEGYQLRQEKDLSTMGLTNNLVSTGQCYFHLGKLEKALEYGTRALENADFETEEMNILDIYKLFMEVYEQKGNFKKSLKYSKLYSDCLEDVLEIESTCSLQAVEEKYNLEMKEKEKIEIELKALRAQINPHFIFNALQAIQFYITDKDSTTANHFLSIFSRLIRTMFDNSERNFIGLNEEKAFLNDYLEIQTLRFNDRLTYQFFIDDSLADIHIAIPPMVIQPHVENAILHGMGDRESLNVSVSFTKHQEEEKAIMCIVEDNGIGREKAREIKAAKERYYTSKGTQVTKDLLDKLSKKLGRLFSVETIDLIDENNEPTGTRVEIALPFNVSELMVKNNT